MQQYFDEEEQNKEYLEGLHVRCIIINGFTEWLLKKLKPFNIMIEFVHKKGDTIFQNVCHLKKKL